MAHLKIVGDFLATKSFSVHENANEDVNRGSALEAAILYLQGEQLKYMAQPRDDAEREHAPAPSEGQFLTDAGKGEDASGESRA